MLRVSVEVVVVCGVNWEEGLQKARGMGCFIFAVPSHNSCMCLCRVGAVMLPIGEVLAGAQRSLAALTEG